MKEIIKHKEGRDKLLKIKDEYIQSFDSLNKNSRIETLEQLLQQDAISEDEALALITKLTRDEQENMSELIAITEFIGKAIRPGKYIRLFNKCTESLGHKPDALFKRQEIIDQLSGNDDYESQLMVLPYIYLSANKKIKTKSPSRPNLPPHKLRELEKEGKNERSDSKLESGKTESYMEKYFNNFEHACDFMNVALSLENRANAEMMVQTAVSYYSGSGNMYFLLPWLPKLKERGLLMNQNTEEILNKTKEGESYKYNRREFYETDEEKKKLKEIADFGNKKLGDNFFHIDELGNDPIAKKFKKEHEEIKGQSNKRMAEHIMSNFNEYAGGMSMQEKFKILTNMLDTSIPIMTCIEKTGLTREDIQKFIKKTLAEGEHMILQMPDTSEVEKLIDLDLEKEAANIILNDIEDTDYTLQITQRMRLIDNVEKLLSLFSEKNKGKIVATINAKMPRAWFSNLDYAIDNKLISFDDLVKSTVRDRWNAVKYYPNLIYKLRKIEKDDEQFAKKKEVLRSTVQKIIEHNITDTTYEARMVKNIVSDADLKEIVLKAINDPNNGIELALDVMRTGTSKGRKMSILNTSAEFKEAATTVIKKTLKDNPERIFTEDSYGYVIKDLLTILPKREVLDRFINCIDKIDISDYLDNGGFVELLLENRSYLDKIIDYLKTDRGVHYITIVADALESYRNPKYNPLDARPIEPGIIHKVNQIYKNAIENNKFLVFQLKIDRTDNKEIYAIALEQGKKEATEFLKQFPEAIEVVLHNLKDDAELYNQIILENLKAVATASTNDKYYPHDIFDDGLLTLDAKNRIARVNPLRGVEWMGVLDEDFYAKVIKEINDIPSFKLHERTLRKIAENEINLRGESKALPKNLDGDFVKLVKEIIQLDNCQWFTENLNEILKMNKREQQKLINLAKKSFLYQIKNNESFKLDNKKISSLEEEISKALLTRLENSMKITLDNVNYEELSPNLVEAMSTYYNSSCSKNPEMAETMKKLVKNICDGNYKTHRSWNEDIEKMISGKLLPQKTTLKQYGIWVSDEQSDLRENLSVSIDDLLLNIRKSVMQAIFDKHIDDSVNKDPNEWLTEYKSLTSELSEINKSGNKGDERQFLSEHGKNINELKALLYLHGIRNISPEEVEAGAINFEGKKIALEHIWRNIEKGLCEKFPEFKADIDKMRQSINESRKSMFGGEKISKKELSITDKFDLETYFCIGEEPVPSCQSYNGIYGGGYNFGLLAYMEDPNTKIIQVYDDNGGIISRNIMRLLEDDNGEPHIFLERIYSVNPHPKLEEAVINFAKNKANAMGVGLYSEQLRKEDDDLDLFEYRELHSRGSRVPYVYTDAGGGRKRNGIYTTNGRKIV